MNGVHTHICSSSVAFLTTAILWLFVFTRIVPSVDQQSETCLGSGKSLIHDHGRCPELKSAGCHLGSPRGGRKLSAETK